MRFLQPTLFSFRAGKLPLRVRLGVYFLSFVLLLLIILLTLLFIFDFLPASQKKIGEDMDDYLTVYERNISLHMGNIVAASQRLAPELVNAVEKTLAQNNAVFSDVTDNAQLIGKLEYESIPLLIQSLRESRSTGAFIILEATLNSSLPKAATSRCGVYLKINTPVNFNTVKAPVAWLRGMPQIASRYRFAIHNNWDMEFDISHISKWDELLQEAKQAPRNSYFFAKAHYLRGTWEKVLLICIPMYGKNGEIYGVCGLEISSLLFKLAHAHLSPPLAGLTGVLALRQQDDEGGVSLDTGAGFQDGPALAIPEDSSVYKATAEKDYNRYSDGEIVFVGREKPLRLAPLPLFGEDATWVAAVLLPQQRERSMLMHRYILVASFLMIFLAIALLLAIFFSRCYAAPVLKGIRNAREEGGSGGTTQIRELDELIAFMKAREQELICQMGENAHEMRDADQVELSAYRMFVNQIETLTKTERIVFDLYITGLNSHEIANKLNLSINTIRTHNRNIYAKLNVTSYKEMMVYIQMMTGRQQG